MHDPHFCTSQEPMQRTERGTWCGGTPSDSACSGVQERSPPWRPMSLKSAGRRAAAASCGPSCCSTCTRQTEDAIKRRATTPAGLGIWMERATHSAPHITDW